MNAKTNAKQVQAYFLIDRTGGLDSYLELIETQLNRLINRLTHDGSTQSHVQLSAIVMNPATYQVIQPIGNWFQLTKSSPGGDLAEALGFVERSVRNVDQESKVELFVLLKNEPAGDWKAKIKSLKADQRVRITVSAFGFGDEREIQTETLREIRTWPGGAVRSMLKRKNVTQLFEWIFKLLKGTVKEMETSAHAAAQAPRTQDDKRKQPPTSGMFDIGISISPRRLPIYLLLGTSSSMAGAPIQAVNQAVNLLYNELMNDPSVIETVHIAVITFDDQARLQSPLTDLMSFTPPTLSAGGGRSMGAALRLLGEWLDRDIIPNTAERRGDDKPLVFLMTDGSPTDSWEHEADAIKNRSTSATIIALGCGGGVNVNMLKRIADMVLIMDTVTPDIISQYFGWISEHLWKIANPSIRLKTQTDGTIKAIPDIDLSLPPPGIQLVKNDVKYSRSLIFNPNKQNLFGLKT